MSGVDDEILLKLDPNKSTRKRIVDEKEWEEQKAKTESQGKQIDSHKRLLDWTFGFIVAILIVCVIAVIGFLLDAWRLHASEYARFKEALTQDQNQRSILNDRIQALELKIQRIEIENEKSTAKKMHR